VIVFLVTLAVLAVAGVSVYYFLGRSGSSDNGGGVSIDLDPADDILIGAYLEANEAKLNQPAGDDDTPVPFIVNPGETAAQIATRLEEAGLISDAELFRRYVQYYDLDAGIEAGEFTLRQTMTIPEVAQTLQRGLIAEQVVTIREGVRLEQVAASVATQTTISEGEFLALARTGWRDAGFSFGFLGDIPAGATLEGFLFPDTYRLPEEATAVDLLERMLQTFEARVPVEMRTAAANRGLTLYDLVTLASIVEREAVLDAERPLIAGVYHNRLRDNWLLGADPTVQYNLGTPEDWWPVLSLEDTKLDSPYNTYRNLGLPPSPICNPGLASIQAVAYPEETQYFFFLADCTKNDGSHLFAVTSEEHNANYAMCGGAP
jgi:UPF0755 protein